MKRSFTALLLAATLLPTGVVLAAEQEHTSATVKQVAGVPEVAPIPPMIQKTMDRLFTLQPAFKQLRIETSTPDKITNTFSISLTDASIGSSGHLTFDMETGELRSFDIQMKEWVSKKKPSTTLAKEKAEQFLISWLGAEGRKQFGEPTSNGSGSSTIYDSDQNPTTWAERQVEFPFLLNNIPVSSREFFRMEVDGVGHIVSFRYNPPNLKNVAIPTATHIRSAEDMKKQLITEDSLALQYVEKQPEKSYSSLKEEQETKLALRYDLLNYGFFDAQTGKSISTMTGEEIKQDSFFSAPWKVVQIHPQGNKLVAHSEKEAAEVVSKAFNFDFSQIQLQKHDDPPFSRDGQGDPYLNYSWTNAKDISIHANGEKASGWITSASLDISGENSHPATVSKEEAFATALAFIEKYTGPTAKELDVQYATFGLEQPPAWVDKGKLPKFVGNEQENHHFWFFERYEGIPVMERLHMVTVDSATGKIISFSLAPYKETLSLPVPKGVISKEKAAESFLQNKKLKLEYVWPSYFDQLAPAPILTYTWEPSENIDDYVDAFTSNYVQVPIERDDEE
ncbi:hypothetical protein DFP93_13111 [Aneurinibacillus soli]|uniref:YcdB/YcdC repeated domain-containing protein n=1 Tax=Aneurinibacillus soli TaxID=1500254 RepID=A0A0U5C8T5_9BACL|nr:YcdB/YcdC domain-containing protein [Aneurinibacillus soli]PYE57374.1 hypothetical protein DFP93_13111 [Aneurinibacillus soli]BAU28771.1 hypothetical protein CB4_02948 [Aneurinibacillus soli]